MGLQAALTTKGSDTYYTIRAVAKSCTPSLIRIRFSRVWQRNILLMCLQCWVTHNVTCNSRGGDFEGRPVSGYRNTPHWHPTCPTDMQFQRGLNLRATQSVNGRAGLRHQTCCCQSFAFMLSLQMPGNLLWDLI